MTAAELVERFSLENISGGNAVFDTEKLDWMNGQYIARLPVAALARAVEPFFREAGLQRPRLRLSICIVCWTCCARARSG